MQTVADISAMLTLITQYLLSLHMKKVLRVSLSTIFSFLFSSFSPISFFSTFFFPFISHLLPLALCSKFMVIISMKPKPLIFRTIMSLSEPRNLLEINLIYKSLKCHHFETCPSVLWPTFLILENNVLNWIFK